VSDRVNKYGIVVDEFLGERNLVVHTIDPRLGKIQDISSASLTENGEPLLIFDVDDLFRSIDIILSGGRLDRLASQQQEKISAKSSKRVLVVDDSITVREVERNLLQSKGYSVEVAVDGMDGWNAARTSQYDLIVSDIDMPRMNGFDFVSMLKGDDRLREVPVIIVSYKDREEDRQRGLEVGADYYLTKGSFHDDSLVDAVMDLIGEP
jgi:two-component system sensor histidine kinase and response regulator WspE